MPLPPKKSKHLLFVSFSLLILGACSNQNKQEEKTENEKVTAYEVLEDSTEYITFSGEFNLPIASLQEPKTLYFQDNDASKSSSEKVQRLLKRENYDFLISVHKKNDRVIDSSIYTAGEFGILEEIYSYQYDSLGKLEGVNKGEVILDQFTYDAGAFSTYESIVRFKLETKPEDEMSRSEKYVKEFHTIEKYIKDTTFTWNEKELRAIKVSKRLLTTLNYDLNISKSHSEEETGYSIYAKGIGRVMSITNKDGKAVSTRLVNIK